MRDRWKGEGPGILQAAEVVRHVVEAVAHGNFAAVFDVTALEQAIREAIKSAAPTRIKLNYDFDAELADYPSGDPILAMDREMYGVEGSERTYGDNPTNRYPKNDLVLATSIEVDVATGERRVVADGRLRPFKLNLLGRGLDLVTIRFKGAHFTAVPGERPKFHADIGRVRIGSMLAFLEKLQTYFNSGPGNGLYREFRVFPSELEVGYRYRQPLIQVGTLQFINIGFHVGAILPLDDRQAEFRFAFASREHPFLIAQPPYGGGGFVGLRANARGIIGFEIQLEFGAVVSVEFGPLSAHGRVTAGIYLENGQGHRVLEGFFHAIGEGSVGCFGVCVNVEIKTRQEDDASMAGSARYVYSFKVGVLEVDFGVTAGHRQPGSRSRRSWRVPTFRATIYRGSLYASPSTAAIGKNRSRQAQASRGGSSQRDAMERI